MATAFSLASSSSLTAFESGNCGRRRLRLPLLGTHLVSRSCQLRQGRTHRICCQAGSKDGLAVADVEEEAAFQRKLDAYVGGNGSGNGNGKAAGYSQVVKENSGSLEAYVNGNGNGNGNLVKYSRRNRAVSKLTEEAPEMTAESSAKRKVEQIGQEEAWFKQGGRDQLEDKL